MCPRGQQHYKHWQSWPQAVWRGPFSGGWEVAGLRLTRSLVTSAPACAPHRPIPLSSSFQRFCLVPCLPTCVLLQTCSFWPASSSTREPAWGVKGKCGRKQRSPRAWGTTTWKLFSLLLISWTKHQLGLRGSLWMGPPAQQHQGHCFPLWTWQTRSRRGSQLTKSFGD